MSELYDPIRKQHVVATPEEYVRQQVISWLLSKGYPAQAIDVEVSLSRFKRGSNDRVDLLVTRFSEDSHMPLFELLVECKRPEVSLDQDLILQVQKYLAIVPARYVVLTNGSGIIYLKRNASNYDVIEGLPDWDEITTSCK
ncbi:MAG: type I restriction enzyme HsdR N-terminal domain-containing protein [Fibrobacterales bacterium]